MQIYGSYNNVSISGVATFVNDSVILSLQYDLTLLKHPILVKIQSSKNEGTLRTKELLQKRIDYYETNNLFLEAEIGTQRRLISVLKETNDESLEIEMSKSLISKYE